VGAIVGAVAGGVAGALASLALEASDATDAAHEETLNEDIGVASGDLGDGKRQAACANGERIRRQRLAPEPPRSRAIRNWQKVPSRPLAEIGALKIQRRTSGHPKSMFEFEVGFRRRD